MDSSKVHVSQPATESAWRSYRLRGEIAVIRLVCVAPSGWEVDARVRRSVGM